MSFVLSRMIVAPFHTLVSIWQTKTILEGIEICLEYILYCRSSIDHLADSKFKNKINHSEHISARCRSIKTKSFSRILRSIRLQTHFLGIDLLLKTNVYIGASIFYSRSMILSYQGTF